MMGVRFLKIVVISDTHMPRMAKKIPSVLEKDLRTSDMIIHAGDWQTLDVYDMFSQYAPVVGVYGNVDQEKVRRKLKEKEIVQFHHVTIGITHGHGKGKSTEERVFQTFADDQVDCIIFGHSHNPVMKTVNGILLFNPGSPTDKRRQKQYSYGVITIEKEWSIKHVYFDSKD